jgi:hypothetical protein
MDRTARNLELARIMFDGYHHAAERGYVDIWKKSDFAPDCVFYAPFMGEMRMNMTDPDGPEYGDGSTIQARLYWKVMPDWHADDFQVWPTETGCASRMCWRGHTTDGEFVEMWEAQFIWTDDEGRITRFEFYDDWYRYARVIELGTGLTLDDMAQGKYIQAIMDAQAADPVSVALLKTQAAGDQRDALTD